MSHFLYVLLTDQISLPGYLFFVSVQYLDNMYIVIVFFSGGDVINFEINLIFLIKSFFLRDQKVKTKILRIERSFKDEKKHFSSVFKGFQLTKIVANLRLHFINYINDQKRTFV